MPRLSLFIKLWTLEYRIGKIRRCINIGPNLCSFSSLGGNEKRGPGSLERNARDTRGEWKTKTKPLDSLSIVRSLEALLFFFSPLACCTSNWLDHLHNHTMLSHVFRKDIQQWSLMKRRQVHSISMPKAMQQKQIISFVPIISFNLHNLSWNGGVTFFLASFQTFDDHLRSSARIRTKKKKMVLIDKKEETWF